MFVAETITGKNSYIRFDFDNVFDTSSRLTQPFSNRPFPKAGELRQLYTKEELYKLAEIVCNAVNKFLPVAATQDAYCCIFEKVCYKDGTRYKNGFHMQFPRIYMDIDAQKTFLYPIIKREIEKSDFVKDRDYLDVDDFVDPSVYRNAWLVYGASKSPNSGVYILSTVFKFAPNGKLELVKDYKRLFEGWPLYKFNDNSEIEITRSNYPNYLPRLFSITPHPRTKIYSMDLKIDEALRNTVISNSVNRAGNYDYNNDSPIIMSEADVQNLIDIVGCLNPRRADRYDSWFKVGLAIYNSSNGTQDGYTLFDQFSQKSERYDEASVLLKWRKFKDLEPVQNPLTIRTLRKFAKQDNPAGYETIIYNNISTQYEVSQLIHDETLSSIAYTHYKGELVCVKSAKSTNSWYYYNTASEPESKYSHQMKSATTGRWIEDENGIVVRKKILKLLEQYVRRIKKDVRLKYDNHELMTPEGKEVDEKSYEKFYTRPISMALKKILDCRGIRNIVTHASDKFYDGTFLERLDANDYLIGIENGVLDFKNGVFRRGMPEDMISKTANVSLPFPDDGKQSRGSIRRTNYDNQMNKISEGIKIFYDFLQKIFPLRERLEYFLDTCCDMMIGRNITKSVYIWVGSGHNGKSTLINLMSKMMGTTGGYTRTLSPTVFSKGNQKGSGTASPELEVLRGGVRIAFASEPEAHIKLNDAFLKLCSGNDMINSRQLYGHMKEFRLNSHFIISGNNVPLVGTTEEALWGRLRIINFESEFALNPPRDIAEQKRLNVYPRNSDIELLLEKHVNSLMFIIWTRFNSRSGHAIVPRCCLTDKTAVKRNNPYLAYTEKCLIRKEGNRITITALYEDFVSYWRAQNLRSLFGRDVPSKPTAIKNFQRVFKDTFSEGMVDGDINGNRDEYWNNLDLYEERV